MVVTSEKITLGNLEGELERLNSILKKELELNASNPKLYTYKSIGVKVYDVKYIREDLRAKIQDSGRTLEAEFSYLSNLYETKCKLLNISDWIRPDSTTMNADVRYLRVDKMMDAIHLVKIDISKTENQKSTIIKEIIQVQTHTTWLNMNDAVLKINSLYDDVYSKLIEAEAKFEATSGKLVGIYKNNGETVEVDTKKVIDEITGEISYVKKETPLHIIDFAYIPDAQLDTSHETISILQDMIISGSITGYLSRLRKINLNTINSDLKTVLSKSIKKTASLLSLLDDNLVGAEVYLASNVTSHFTDSDRKLLNDNIETLSGAINLNGISKEDGMQIKVLQNIMSFLSIFAPATIPIAMASSGLIGLIGLGLKTQQSKELGIAELDRFKGFDLNILPNLPTEIDATLDYGFDNIVADGTEKNTVHGNGRRNEITVVGGNDNELYGEGGDDILIGSDLKKKYATVISNGKDKIVGGLGNDTIIGGSGDDHLIGGKGRDKYIFKGSHGDDVIEEQFEFNMGMPNGVEGEIVVDELNSMKRVKDDLILYTNADSSITIKDYFLDGTKGFLTEFQSDILLDGESLADRVEDDNIATEIYGTYKSETIDSKTDNKLFLPITPHAIYTLRGLGGNDHLNGAICEDILIGGEGDDTLEGKEGNDTYIYERGDGNDTIKEFEDFPDSGVKGVKYKNLGEDTLSINVSIQDLIIDKEGEDLIFRFKNSTSDSIRVLKYYADDNKAYFDDVKKPIEKLKIGRKTYDISKDLSAVQELTGIEKDYCIVNLDGTKTPLDYPSVYIKLDGDVLDFKYTPYNKNGHTMVSVKEFADKVCPGTVVQWDDKEKRAIIVYKGSISWIDYDDNIIDPEGEDASVKGIKEKMDVAPDMVQEVGTEDHKLMAHVGVLSKIFNLNVSWDGENNTAVLKKRDSDDGHYQQGDNDDDTLYAGNEGSYILGGNGNDLIHGGKGRDTLVGGQGNDVIYGYEGDDYLDGDENYGVEEGGNDILHGGDGNDLLQGDNGDDILYGDNGEDTLYGCTGNDTLFGGAGNDHLFGDHSSDDFGNDTLYGGEGDDQIFGYSGIDIMYGGVGNDSIWGGDGNDILHGNVGKDTLYGDAGDDIIYGDEGDDWICGDGGNDELYGGFGDDELHGSYDDNILYGGEGNDRFYSGYGNDILMGGNGKDDINNSGNDEYCFYKNYGVDIIYDSNLDTDNKDVIILGDMNTEDVQLKRNMSNLEVLIKGTEDKIIVDRHFVTEEITIGNEIQHINHRIEEIHFKVYDDDGLHETIWNAADIEEALKHIKGTDSDETLDGYDGDEEIKGYGGNDILNGNAGNDLLSGGKGNDMLNGGTGNDVYEFEINDGYDTIYEDDSLLENRDDIKIIDDSNNISFKREGSDLTIKYGSDDLIRVSAWFNGASHQIERIFDSNSNVLLNTQINQLIEEMSGFPMGGYVSWENFNESDSNNHENNFFPTIASAYN
ncbi:stalk domain-containing protein [Fusibacter ferrireducens]|uniref:Copper amine oxidase-like N-terminal domain-containing protein n=2 Tax=Fusibacter ferrireducens TaxID=2785058 RepID=A0ABR9ZQC6_9FIRM|nr:stalk domain-containing protein [Fusibacter ferrireducens]MBF4692653.1 hypothetical protein [Fusibacter ferrireducens]